MYITSEATRKQDVKNKLWRRFKRTKCEYDRIRYITVKIELRSLTRNLRIKFENDTAQCMRSASKQFGSYVKSKTKTRCRIPTLKKPDGIEAIALAIAKAETLNNLFSSTFTEERLEVIPSDINKSFFSSFLEILGITSLPKEITRLGKPCNDKKQRPIKVKMTNAAEKDKVVSRLRNLKNSVRDDYTNK